jgi:hypothetical protein
VGKHVWVDAGPTAHYAVSYRVANKFCCVYLNVEGFIKSQSRYYDEESVLKLPGAMVRQVNQNKD